MATSIKGYTQLLRRHAAADPSGRAERWTGIIDLQVGVLTDTLSALVDLGRVQCGRLSLDRQPVDLRRVVEAAITRLPAEEGAAALELHLPSETAVGRWDATRLEPALAAALASIRRAAGEATEAVDVALQVADGELVLCAGAVPDGDRWPAPGEWAAGADANLYLLRALVEAHGGTAGYRCTAGCQPLLRLTLPRGFAPAQ
jgi:K+-sensing histidine kinase KdpD